VRRLPAVAGLLAGMVLVSTAARSTHATASPRSVTVHIANFAFEPRDTAVSIGDTVVWINDDEFEHVVVADSQAWSSPTLAHGRHFAFVATRAGRFPYHCSAHPVMRGTLEVKE
jgi:plastocyanin